MKDISDKGVLDKIHKGLLKCLNKKTSNSTVKWTKGLQRYFTKEHIQMANKQLKKKTLNNICHQGHANYNNEIPLHIY